MLRIFRGERHAESAAQPGQHEQNAGAQAGQQSPAADVTAPPQSAGGASPEAGTQSLPVQEQPDASQAAPPAEAASTSQAAPQAEAAPTSQAGPQAEAAPTSQAASQAEAAPPSQAGPQQQPAEREPGFLDRGRMRRRARFLRVARELAYRDLGGLVFDLHRFGQRNDEIVKAKLDTVARIDSELRALESALREHKPVAVLREAGVAACPRCAAIHGSGDRFCPTCGLSVDQAERPIAAPNAPAGVPPPSNAGWPPPAHQPLEAWPGALAARPPAAQAPAASAAPPIPQPSHAPDAAAPAAAPAAAAPPAGRVLGATDPPTEVIRSGLRPTPDPSQQTVAFDPIASPPGEAKGEQDGERSQDRP